MSEWNHMTVSEYLREVYVTLNQKMELRTDSIVVHSCCAHFQKRVPSTIHNKFPKYIKNKNIILECMGILIHCSTIHDLDYCYEKFMTILLTKSSKEANSSIFDINKCNTSKYEFENEAPSQKSNSECETNFMDEDNKLEGRIFMDSPFYKRYVSKMCELQKSVVNIGSNDNKYYAPEIANYITNHYMPFAPM